MPMLHLTCSVDVPKDLIQELSTMIAETIGKPEQYVMVAVSKADMLMSGSDEPAAYAEIKSLGGLDRLVNHELTMKLCVLLSDHLGIRGDRTYVTFHSLERDCWGWNGKTFG